MAYQGEANVLSTLDGLFKEQYASKGIENLVPSNKKLQEMIKFNSSQKNGGKYISPVILGIEHGITYAHEDDGAFELNESIAGTMKPAKVSGYQMVLRSAISYSAASRAMSSAQAFQDSTKLLVANMLDSVRNKLEVQLMLGKVGIGKVKAIVGSEVELEASHFAPGVWAGAEKMKIDSFDSGNSGTTADASGVIVQKVDFVTKKITVSSAADITVGATLYPHKAKGKEMDGLHSILSNEGLLFDINAQDYHLWKGNKFDARVGGLETELTFAILQQAIAKAVEKGLDRDVTVLVNPGHWDDLLTNEESLRNYDSSYKPEMLEKGSKAIKFHSQNGMVEIVPSTMVMEGFAYVICPEDFQRIGSTDVTFRRPGQGDNFFRELESNAGFELRAYSDQALFCVKPSRQILIEGLKV
jgi:hypothetical protein